MTDVTLRLTRKQYDLLDSILGSFGDNAHEMPDEAEYLAEQFETTPEELDEMFAALKPKDVTPASLLPKEQNDLLHAVVSFVSDQAHDYEQQGDDWFGDFGTTREAFDALVLGLGYR